MWVWCRTISSLLGWAMFLFGCQSAGSQAAAEWPPQAPIAYPFPGTSAVGRDPRGETVILRSRGLHHEYAIELPDAPINLEIPLETPSDLPGEHPETLGSTSRTDQELTADMPRLGDVDAAQTRLLDHAFGVQPAGRPAAAPSFTLGISKIQDYFRQRQYTYALIEVNNMLNFYPTSVRLLKMKGSLYVKLGELRLADQSWQQAEQLQPDDVEVQRARQAIARRLAESK